MTDTSDGSKPGKGRVSGREMADALADVLREQTQKTQRNLESPRKPQRSTSPLTWGAFFVLGLGMGYVWMGSPGWLDRSPPPVPASLADAGLRMEVFHHALLIQEFVETQGRLPRDLSEVGKPLSPVDYERVNPGAYTLVLSNDLGTVEYRSTESLQAFLGNALDVVRRGS